VSAQAVMSRDGTAGPDIGNHTYSDETAAWLASRKPHCEVLTDDAFGIIVQVVLALLGFGALLLKRKYEHPRREFQVWALDVTKQAVSGAILHLFGMFSSGVMNHYTAHLDSGDHCSWYFISFSFGTVSHASAFSLRYAVSLTLVVLGKQTFGTAISYGLVVLQAKIAPILKFSSLEHSGEYGHPLQVRV
jgi:hypothetical protein